MLEYEAKALLEFTAHIIENVERSQKLVQKKLEEIKSILKKPCEQCEERYNCKIYNK